MEWVGAIGYFQTNIRLLKLHAFLKTQNAKRINGLSLGIQCRPFCFKGMPAFWQALVRYSRRDWPKAKCLPRIKT